MTNIKLESLPEDEGGVDVERSIMDTYVARDSNSSVILDIAAVNRSKMSRDLGIDIAHVSRILSGKSHPSLAMARRIADYLKISVEDLCRAIPTNR